MPEGAFDFCSRALQTKAGHFEVIVNTFSFYTIYMLISKIWTIIMWTATTNEWENVWRHVLFTQWLALGVKTCSPGRLHSVCLPLSGRFHRAAQTVELKRMRNVLDRCHVVWSLSVPVISSRFLRIAISWTIVCDTVFAVECFFIMASTKCRVATSSFFVQFSNSRMSSHRVQVTERTDVTDFL